MLYILSCVPSCVVWYFMLYYVFYSKFSWFVLYTTFDSIIFVQETRFCLLSYFSCNIQISSLDFILDFILDFVLDNTYCIFCLMFYYALCVVPYYLSCVLF